MSRRRNKRKAVFVVLCTSLAAGVSLAIGSEVSHWLRRDGGGDLPAQYAALVNPLPHSPEGIRRGQMLFLENCSSCHGRRADGQGPAAAALQPSPADLRERAQQLSEAYLFYRISEGKTGTAMPSFYGSLTPEERWLIVRYLRSLR